jgi:hypothetical protein
MAIRVDGDRRVEIKGKRVTGIAGRISLSFAVALVAVVATIAVGRWTGNEGYTFSGGITAAGYWITWLA